MREPYTHDELRDLRRQLEISLADCEREQPDIRPLPPMDEEEAKELLVALTSTATTRLLSHSESFFIGQLIAAYRMAVEARMLGKAGRYYVVHEGDLKRMREDRSK